VDIRGHGDENQNYEKNSDVFMDDPLSMSSTPAYAVAAICRTETVRIRRLSA